MMKTTSQLQQPVRTSQLMRWTWCPCHRPVSVPVPVWVHQGLPSRWCESYWCFHPPVHFLPVSVPCTTIAAGRQHHHHLHHRLHQQQQQQLVAVCTRHRRVHRCRGTGRRCDSVWTAAACPLQPHHLTALLRQLLEPFVVVVVVVADSGQPARGSQVPLTTRTQVALVVFTSAVVSALTTMYSNVVDATTSSTASRLFALWCPARPPMSGYRRWQYCDVRVTTSDSWPVHRAGCVPSTHDWSVYMSDGHTGLPRSLDTTDLHN